MHNVARATSKNDQVDDVFMKVFLGPSVVNAGVCTMSLFQNVPSQLPSVAAAAATESPDSGFEHLIVLPERDRDDVR